MVIYISGGRVRGDSCFVLMKGWVLVTMVMLLTTGDGGTRGDVLVIMAICKWVGGNKR